MNEPTPGESRKPRVAVVFGGRSSEHGISCVTAGSVLQAIDREMYDVVPVGIATDGRWVLESGDPDRLRIESADKLPTVDGTRADDRAGPGRPARPTWSSHEPSQPPQTLGEVDVVFPLLHGPWGEDGTIQGMLEMAGVRYVGAGVLASAVSMDKAYMKIVLAGRRPAGDAVGHGHRPRVGSATRRPAASAPPTLGYPLFVKPARGGSSIGISKAHDAVRARRGHRGGAAARPQGARRGLGRGRPRGRVRRAAGPRRHARDQRAGRDPGHRRPRVLRLRREVPPRGGTPSSTSPPTCPTTSPARLRELAARAFEAVGCEGLARVDFFVMPDGSLVVNEINTMPGLHADVDVPADVGRQRRWTTPRWSTG